MDDLETSLMLLPRLESTDPPKISTPRYHCQCSHLKLYHFRDLAGIKGDLDGIVGLDDGVRITDGSAIVSDNVWYRLTPNPYLCHLCELVLAFLGSDPVDRESSLGIIQQTEELIGFFN